MPKVIICDTSCFIVLSRIGELELLGKLYGRITTTVDIAAEYGQELPIWVDVVSVKDADKQRLLELQIDKVESSAIALALELVNCLLILDDFKARKIAVQLGFTVTGTLGIIVKAKFSGIIPMAKPIIDKMKKSGFFLPLDLEKRILKEAGE